MRKPVFEAKQSTLHALAKQFLQRVFFLALGFFPSEVYRTVGRPVKKVYRRLLLLEASTQSRDWCRESICNMTRNKFVNDLDLFLIEEILSIQILVFKALIWGKQGMA